MIDFLRIHVIWAPGSSLGDRIAELISKHFDGIGMERDGVAYRIPVRFRSEPWNDAGPPVAIDLSAARHNAVVVLHDDYMHADKGLWGSYVTTLHAQIAARSDADIYIPFGSPSGEPALQADKDRHIQYARRDLWKETLATQDAMDSRLLLHLAFTIRRHLRKTLGRPLEDEQLFVSHAKADGDITAKAIVDYVNDTGHDVPLSTFYDAMELSPGDDFRHVFESKIANGTLLAIVSDVYDSRPWCVYELTTAKRLRRPIVLADVGKKRTSRTYPYGANVPRVRISTDLPLQQWVEPLLVETLSEGLRCDLIEAQANLLLGAAGIAGALILPRPPELFDIVDAASLSSTIVYPDPPLSRIEDELLKKCLGVVSPSSKMLTLSQIT